MGVSSCRRGHGKIGFFDLAATVAANWKKTPKEEREPYEELARQDKLRFQKEMQEYEATSLYLADNGTQEPATVSVASSDSAAPSDATDDEEEESTRGCSFVNTEAVESFSSPKSRSFPSNGGFLNDYQAPTIIPSDRMTGPRRMTGPGLFPGTVQAPLSLPSSRFLAAQASIVPSAAANLQFGAGPMTTSSSTPTFHHHRHQPMNGMQEDDLEPTPFAPMQNGRTFMARSAYSGDSQSAYLHLPETLPSSEREETSFTVTPAFV